MESNGRPNHIQVSQQTADNLKEANKLHWLVPRSEMVHAKGKGLVQTFWVADKSVSQSGDGGSQSHYSETASDHSDNEADEEEAKEDAAAVALAPPRRAWSDLPPHMQRLIHWNVDMLGKLLKNVVAGRRAAQPPPPTDRRQSRIMSFSINLGIVSRPSASSNFSSGTEGSNTPSAVLTLNNPRDEYAEAISLPRFDPTILLHDVDPSNIQLDEMVAKQLEDYVTTIACAYHENPFHNFEHASHVTMSANKILKRVVAGDELTVRKSSLDKFASRLHNFTYGITSDPLTHFACVFSA
jgi:hypothetical protein